MYNMYHENGVIIKPNVVVEGDRATVMYNGLLSCSGADAIYLHVGFGENWDQMQDIKMERSGDGFEAGISIRSHDLLEMAFRDSAEHWDNNSGRNYSFEVQHRQ